MAATAEKTVGVRDRKARLSEHLREVKRGKPLVITERGKPIARIIPLQLTERERLLQAVKAGIIDWSGKRPSSRMPTIRPAPGTSVADLVSAGRDWSPISTPASS